MKRQSLIIFLDQRKKKLVPYHNFLNDVKRSLGCWSVYVYATVEVHSSFLEPVAPVALE